MARKGPDAFRTIAEAAEEVGVPSHVLRFWETQFPFIRPLKRAGGRRFYRPADIAALRELRRLLHDEGLSIKTAQALPKTVWRRAAAVPKPAPDSAPPGATPIALMQAALDRAVRARRALDALISSSTG